jgi:hypothetical protein
MNKFIIKKSEQISKIIKKCGLKMINKSIKIIHH